MDSRLLGLEQRVYAWNAGYWGPHIGFYGGINYGFGYGGVGFVGGEWRGGAFFYNTAVMHVDTVHITNVYVNRTVIVNNDSHVAFNGGEGGVAARPTAQEETYARETHTPPVAAQVQQEHAASQNKRHVRVENHGAPAVAATARPGEFSGHGVVAAKAAGAPYHAPAMSPKEARAPAPAASNKTAAPHNNVARPVTPPVKNTEAPAKNTAPAARNTEAAPAKSTAAPREAAPRTETARPATESHPQTEARPQPKSEPKPQAKPAAKPKPAPKPAPKEEKEKK